MKIAVCLKLVPATTADMRVAADGQSLLLADVELGLSFFDEHALEAALRLREATPGATIQALAVGGAECVKCLQHAYALGADSALHIRAPGADARAAAALAAAALRGGGHELVLCGRQALDDDLWLFPGALAERLGWPHVSAVATVEVAPDGKAVRCRRDYEGAGQLLQAALPAVVSCGRGLHEPRVPALKRRLAAKRMQPPVVTPDSLGVAVAALAPAFSVVRYEPPRQRTPRRMIAAAPLEAAAALARILREQAGNTWARAGAGSRGAALKTADGRQIFLLRAGDWAREVGGRLATRFGGALASDCLAVSAGGGGISVTRLAYCGRVLVTAELAGAGPLVATVRGSGNLEKVTAGGTGKCVPWDETASLADPRVTVLEAERAESGRPDLAQAAVIVAGGYGVGSAEKFRLIHELAEALGAAVGASRAAVDAGFAPYSMQVGQSGQTVSPGLYVACGISGSQQHLAGMRTSKRIVAINKDPSAPIFKACDYGVVGDLFAVAPALLAELARKT